MSDNALDTLFLPFEKGIIPVPGGRMLFTGAQAHPFLNRFGDVRVVQPFYPYHASVKKFKDPQDGETFSAALCLLPKQKEEARHDLALALSSLDDGGLIAACAANDAGGTRIEGWMKELGLSPQNLPKNKARVCWAVKTSASSLLPRWVEDGKPRTILIDNEEWVTQPGLFGWNRADAGSILLLRHLPDDLTGCVADFGCGYGYLSRAILKQGGVRELTGIDADKRAVACAALNVPDARAKFVWGDLSAAVAGVSGLDAVIMNPPFHEGKSTVPALGKAFIATAAAALKPGGRLYMVANAHLDYESILKTHFAQGDKLAETGGFKIFCARK